MGFLQENGIRHSVKKCCVLAEKSSVLGLKTVELVQRCWIFLFLKSKSIKTLQKNRKKLAIFEKL